MSSEREPCEFAVVIATKEEYQVFERCLVAQAGRQARSETVGGQPFYLFEWTRAGRAVRWVVTFVELERSVAGTRAATQRLLDRWAPRLLISYGISGAVSADVALGDVVVAQHVYEYLSRSKVSPTARSPSALSFEDILLGGDPHRPFPPFTKFFSQIDTLFPDHYSKWHESARGRIDRREIPTEELWRTGAFREESKIIVGPVATAPWVVSHPGMKEWLRLHVDRNLHAVDTESAGVLAAARDLSETVPTLVIRGISDAAEAKTAVDQIGGGAVREWALANAADALFLFLATNPAFASQSPEPKVPRELLDALHAATVAHGLAGKDADLPLEPANRLFGLLVGGSMGFADPANVFEAASRSIEAPDGYDILRIDGAPGVGKSRFLHYLYATLRAKRERAEDARAPALVDAAVAWRRQPKGTFKALREETLQACSSVLGALASAIRSLPEQNFVLLVDGVDAYNLFREEVLVEIRALMHHHPRRIRVVLAARSGEMPDAFREGMRPMMTLSAPPAAACDAVVAAYIATLPRSVAKASLLDRIRRHQLDFVDLTLLHVLSRWGASSARSGSDSLSAVLRTFCLEYLPQAVTLESAARLTFRSIVQHQSDPMFDGSTEFLSCWRLMHLHPQVMHYLVAVEVVRIIRSYASAAKKGELAPPKELDYVYPSSIMRRVKDIVNASEDVQWDVVAALQHSHAIASPRMLAVLCYLGGRVELRPASLKVKPVLNKVIERFRDLANGDDREALLVLRSAYVSLMSLGQQDAGVTYLQGLLRNKTWDNLNRGFHLEYYGDIAIHPDRTMCHEDVLMDCTKTTEHLMGRVRAGLDRPNPPPLFPLEVYTLCSLARHRHAAPRSSGGWAADDEGATKLSDTHRLAICDLIDQLLKHQEEHLIPTIRDYVAATKTDLEITDFRVGLAAEVFYRLKSYKRMGWADRGVENCESIAAHVFGAYILGFFFLPPSQPPDYDKQKVLNMVMVHDLAESVTGDISAPRKSLEDKKRERDVMAYFAMLGTYDEIDGDVVRLLSTFEEYGGKVNLNAQIAHELDKLDNLVQLYLYRRDHAIEDFDKWHSELTGAISTRQGRHVLAVLLQHLRDRSPASFGALAGPEVPISRSTFKPRRERGPRERAPRSRKRR